MVRFLRIFAGHIISSTFLTFKFQTKKASFSENKEENYLVILLAGVKKIKEKELLAIILTEVLDGSKIMLSFFS